MTQVAFKITPEGDIQNAAPVATVTPEQAAYVAARDIFSVDIKAAMVARGDAKPLLDKAKASERALVWAIFDAARVAAEPAAAAEAMVRDLCALKGVTGKSVNPQAQRARDMMSQSMIDVIATMPRDKQSPLTIAKNLSQAADERASRVKQTVPHIAAAKVDVAAQLSKPGEEVTPEMVDAMRDAGDPMVTFLYENALAVRVKRAAIVADAYEYAASIGDLALADEVLTSIVGALLMNERVKAAIAAACVVI